MHQRCDASFSGSHLCHAAEYVLSNSMAQVPAGGAWLDPSMDHEGLLTFSASPTFGRYAAYNGTCDNWNDATTSYTGARVTEGGAVTTSYDCNVSRPLACCNGTPKTRFAGFTAFTTTGSVTNGRLGLHRACAAQYPNSHFCHASEYVRASSLDAIPATGAWIDPSTTGKGQFTVSGLPMAGRFLGYSGTCDNWSDATTSFTGARVSPRGNVTTAYDCNLARPIACCY